jgi:hypothetical protein
MDFPNIGKPAETLGEDFSESERATVAYFEVRLNLES